ncbi:MAG: hypothetical protein HZA14_05185 [Nitrospirae bacterium]|nr:hypothetical protein [Nitrospirota bacterium]
MNDKVVITGMGIVSSLGLTAAETWDALLSGKCGILPIADFDVSGFGCKSAAQVHGLNPSELGVHPRDARIMDKHSHMLLKCGQDAFREGGMVGLLPEDIGFFAGMGMVDYKIDDLMPAVLKSLDSHGDLNYDSFYTGAYQEIFPLWPLSMLNNISFCQIAINLGIKGENTVFSPHADSGAQAIIEGVNTILGKKAQAVLAGGVSEKVSPLSTARASWFGASSPLGEGCGVIALELLSSAKQRGVPYFAAITGYACTFGKDERSNCPTAEAVSNAMEQALAKASLKPSDIDLVIAHGDGTDIGDRNEIEAIHHTFSKCIDKINAYSSKGALGHMLAGAPAVDVILGAYIIQHGIIPAVCNTGSIDKSVKFNLVKEPLKADVKRVLINSFSCEGQCVSLIIEKIN